MDKGVVIHGTSRADMNGKCGVATDFHPMDPDGTTWRYTVKLDSGEEYKLRPERLRSAEEEGAGARAGGGARPKKKSGKGGKKNRS